MSDDIQQKEIQIEGRKGFQVFDMRPDEANEWLQEYVGDDNAHIYKIIADWAEKKKPVVTVKYKTY